MPRNNLQDKVSKFLSLRTPFPFIDPKTGESRKVERTVEECKSLSGLTWQQVHVVMGNFDQLERTIHEIKIEGNSGNA